VPAPLRWQDLLDSVQLAVIAIAPDDRITFAKPFLLSLTGYTENELTSKTTAMLVRIIAAELLKFQGLVYAVSSSAPGTDSLPDTLLTRSIMRSFHSKRSGDIYLVSGPNVLSMISAV
jgi:PAS domain-containing protein